MEVTDRIISDNSNNLQDDEIGQETFFHVEDGAQLITEPRSDNPMEWTRDDVALWLRQCNLEKFILTFQENNIDGFILMSAEFDQSMIKDLIPTVKDRILFKIARKSLRHNFEKMHSDTSINNQKSIINRYMCWKNTEKLSQNKIIFIVVIILCIVLFSSYYATQIKRIRLPSKRIYEKVFDLYDDDGLPIKCPSYIRFNLNNRRHFVVMIVTSLKKHIWKNFLGLLCSGIDVYIMLDEQFDINSPSRVDAEPHSQRHTKSYSHRFLYISNESLQQDGVSYMNKLPQIQFTAWDRTVAWLYTRSNFSTVWLIEQDVQWYHPDNMTKLFNLFISDKTDLLCEDFFPREQYWDHWPTTKSDIFPEIYWTGSFSPLVRWSYRLLRSHYQYMRLIHQNRLQAEFDIDYRFQEFIFATIAKMEKFILNVYSNYDFLNIGLDIYDDNDIIQQILQGNYILHRVKHDSILTRHKPNVLARMIERYYTKDN